MRKWLCLAALPLTGCLWRSVGDGARPRLGLEAVERSPAAEAAVRVHQLAPEPGARGYFFADSLIAFRTRANLAAIHFRLWNRGSVPVRVEWVHPPLAGAAGSGGQACPDDAGAWELRGGEGWPGPAQALGPGASREGDASPAARVRTSAGDAWLPVALPCFVYDPAGPRVALRLGVETAAGRYLYTFWYRLLEPPREDRAVGGDAAAPP